MIGKKNPLNSNNPFIYEKVIELFLLETLIELEYHYYL